MGGKIYRPIIEVQGELVSGIEVDLWSTDPDLIESNCDAEVYPIGDYLAEIRGAAAKVTSMIDKALAIEMGVDLN